MGAKRPALAPCWSGGLWRAHVWGRLGGRPCRHRRWQMGHRLGRWRGRVPGSPRAAPGEAESSGPQEVLKPPHTLEIPAGQQRRRRERVSGLARTGQGACSVAGGDRCYPSTCLFPTEGPRLGRQATKQERAQQGQKARTQVLVTKGSCTPGHHQDRPQHLRAGRPPSPQPHPSPPARVGERLCVKLLPQSRAGLGS